MPRGGSKPGERRGGRKTGTQNHVNADQRDRALTSGPSPLDVMLETMRFLRAQAVMEQSKGPLTISLNEKGEKTTSGGNPKIIRDYLMDAANIAKDAAQYVHPKLQSTTLKGEGDQPITHTLNIKFV
jgi:hypothetical protein